MRGLVLFALCVGCAACATTDSVGRGDTRIDDGEKSDAEIKKAEKEGKCGPDGKGDVVLLDGKTGGPLTCALVTVSTVQDSCSIGSECPSDVLFQGRTNRRGQFASPRPFARVRLEAVSEGYGTGILGSASLASGKVLEVEMPPDPDEGFWLKILDTDGNYLQDLSVTFRSGDDVLAALRTNVLANVFFTQRNPFSGQEVTAEAEGYQSLKISGASDLGDDGHTLTLKKR
ncbi:MAG: hypothetical protein JNK82_07530 [Myxococcaceae bacterium]|nr:hypothetical protein [Myxococcaceae bacterium]